MKKLNVLIVGGGGREHALAWKISKSPRLDKLFVAPGNSGTQKVATNVSIPVTDIKALIKLVKENKIDLTIVGPEDPLELGIVDAFKKAGLKVFGPTKLAAKIETSKAFSKKLMITEGIPTAKFKVFSSYDKAMKFVSKSGAPIVVKADGLSLGKGVFICTTIKEAESAVKKIMIDKKFGESGNRVVIEEFLEGQEISCHVITDGKSFQFLPMSQDHKAIYENDKGPNTGGIGSIVPVPWFDKTLADQIDKRVVRKALKGLKGNNNFVGCLFPGLKVTKDGPKVLEFNARFGDPETESYVRIIKSDLLEVFEACASGKLSKIKIGTYPYYACCIVLTSEGYPGKYKKGFLIKGLDEVEKVKDIVVFHFGTRFDGSNYFTNGGRVLGVTAVGQNLKEALDKAYKAVDKISFTGMYYRRDIGAKSLNYHI